MLREAPVEVTVAERVEESRRRADRARRRGEEPEREREREGARDRLRFRIDEIEVAPPAESSERLGGEQSTVEEAADALPIGEAPAGEAPEGELPAPAAAPEPGISAEEVTAREAEAAAAQAALESAQDSPSLMATFQQAPPTVKAQASGELGGRLNEVMGTETRVLEEATPQIQAEMNGNTPAQPGEITPPTGEVVLEPADPAPAPEPEGIVGELVANEGEYTGNQGVLGSLRGSYSPESGAASVERALENVQVTAPGIVASPGSSPPIEQSGETDPQRFQNQASEGSRQAREALAEQQQAVAALPGVERVQLADVHEAVPVGELPVPGVSEAPAPEGAQQYLQMGLTPDVQTAFDGLAGPAMQESMAEAQGQMQQAVVERDSQHDEQVAQAQEQAAEAQRQAETDQRAQVGETRGQIDRERQSVSEQQAAAVADAESQAENQRQTDREQFDARVRTDQERIDTRYNEAERDATAEVREGERQAEAERARAERESENQSWWEKALDFIANLFDALVGLINGIFDAVRSAVNAILDAARDFAIGLIELAASALKGLIEAFGEFLKGLVQGLLGNIFPGLARALTQMIDGAVALANSAIDVIADGLKSAVNSIVEGLRAGLNRLIDIYQSAVNAAVALARAALTGDWGAFIIQLLEAACRVVGIDPQEMYAFIGRAQETIQLIIDNPGQFLSNALEALMGGFRRFADNFLVHLQAGIIGWLTGALGGAGITLPERFDLMGVINLVAQILGLTWENLRARLVRLVGERGVQVLEFVAGYVQALIEGGWTGLWERIQNDLSALRDMVLEQIRTFLVERIIMAAVTRLATMFNPVGALVNILLAAYNFYTFIRDQIQRIYTVVQTIVDAIGNIARGVLGPAQERIESFLAGLLPLAIDLLARLIGLGNVGERVREILQRVQDTIWGAIDRLIERVVGLFRGGQGQEGDGQAPEVGAAGTVSQGQIGEPVPVPTRQGEHTLYIVRGQNGAEEMVASTPVTIRERLTGWNQQLDRLSNEPVQGQTESDRAKGGRLIGSANTHLTTLDRYADQLAAAAVQNAGQQAAQTATQPTPNSTQVATEATALAQNLGQLFDLFGEIPGGGGSLLQQYHRQADQVHPWLNNAMVTVLGSMEQVARGENEDPVQRYPNWGEVRTGINRGDLSSRPGVAFRDLLERPFSQHTSSFLQQFSQYVHAHLLVNPLTNAVNKAKGSDEEQHRKLKAFTREPGNFIEGQKGAMNSAGPGYPRSKPAITDMIFEASQEPSAAAIFLDELVGRAADADTSPFHSQLSQQAVVDLVVAKANGLSGDDTWTAVFAAAGRQLTAERSRGSINKDDPLTLELLRGAALAQDIAAFTTAISRALRASSNFMVAQNNPSVNQVNAFASWLAQDIMNNIKGKPLYFVRPTDIPRNIPQTVPYVRVRQVDDEPVAVAPSLYSSLAADIVNFLNLNNTQIHHVLPQYLGGGHEIQNLAVVFGGAGSSGTPHQMLHAVIDNIDIRRYMNTSLPRLTLRVEDLTRHYLEFNILIGVLRVGGEIEWEDTGKRLQTPGTG